LPASPLGRIRYMSVVIRLRRMGAKKDPKFRIVVAELLRSLPVSVTRLAQGLPAGGGLDQADELTLSRALAGRTKL